MSVVVEIALNNLAQHGLDEDHPARIFGATVEHEESDRVERAREELGIVELDGQLKRRRIEPIQCCLEA